VSNLGQALIGSRVSLIRPYLRLFESNDLRQEDLVISLENAQIDEAKDLELALEVSQTRMPTIEIH
jgi:hypothetical protein